MAARRMMLPDYGTVSMKGTQYYRTRVTDQQGRRVSLYARTREELYQKEQEAIQQIENKTYRRSTPTVEVPMQEQKRYRRALRMEPIQDLLPVYLLQLRIISALREKQLPVHRRSLRILCRSTMPRLLTVWNRQVL